MKHPNIVKIYEVGEIEGRQFLAMEYEEGTTLAQLALPLPSVEAAESLRGLARAMEFAHERGIIHRDLKPSKVLVGRAGKLRITDFGLAKRIKGYSDLTVPGQILGSPQYVRCLWLPSPSESSSHPTYSSSPTMIPPIKRSKGLLMCPCLTGSSVLAERRSAFYPAPPAASAGHGLGRSLGTGCRHETWSMSNDLIAADGLGVYLSLT